MRALFTSSNGHSRGVLCLLLWLSACSQYQYTLRETNDYFTFYNKDSDYTQGLELEAKSPTEAWAIGQDIYTPVHKREDPPRANERPYAGYIYGRYASPVTGYEDVWYSITPGWIGPGALGEVAQCGIHALLSQACPVGWHHQLGNRPALQGDISKQWPLGHTTYEIKASAGIPQSAIFGIVENSWNLGVLKLTSRCELAVFGYDALLDADGNDIEPRRYRGTLRLGLSARSYTYFLAIQTPSYKEQGSSYNYGGIEVTW